MYIEDFVIAAIFTLIPVVYLWATRKWSERDYINRWFTAEEEARFFGIPLDEVRKARRYGCK